MVMALGEIGWKATAKWFYHWRITPVRRPWTGGFLNINCHFGGLTFAHSKSWICQLCSFLRACSCSAYSIENGVSGWSRLQCCCRASSRRRAAPRRPPFAAPAPPRASFPVQHGVRDCGERALSPSSWSNEERERLFGSLPPCETRSPHRHSPVVPSVGPARIEPVNPNRTARWTRGASLDHLVGTGEQRERHGEAKRPGPRPRSPRRCPVRACSLVSSLLLNGRGGAQPHACGRAWTRRPPFDAGLQLRRPHSCLRKILLKLDTKEEVTEGVKRGLRILRKFGKASRSSRQRPQTSGSESAWIEKACPPCCR